VLVQLRKLGYGAAALGDLDDMVHRALASGQPAVDYIGSGGGAFLTRTDVKPPRAAAQ
jgi:hypothetical protein